MARQTREEREQEVREQYEAVTDKLYTDRQAFKDFLSFSGKHYKLPADHAMMIFSSNPDRKSTRLNSSHYQQSRMPSSA